MIDRRLDTGCPPRLEVKALPSEVVLIRKGWAFAGQQLGGGDSLRQKQRYVIVVQSVFQSMFSLPPN